MEIQAIANAAAIIYSGVGSFVLLRLVAQVMPLRADQGDRATGMDVSQHWEEAYIHDDGGLRSHSH